MIRYIQNLFDPAVHAVRVLRFNRVHCDMRYVRVWKPKVPLWKRLLGVGR